MTTLPTRLWRALRVVLTFYLIAIVLVLILALAALGTGLSPQVAFFVAFAGWPLAGLALRAHRRYRAARTRAPASEA